MVGFLVGLIVAIVAAAGVYYAWFMQEVGVREERGTSQPQVQVNARAIPPGTLMEDGTIPE